MIYEKVRNGDSLTDAEVLYGWSYFSKLSKDLYKLGPVFELQARECRRVGDVLEDMYTARRRKQTRAA